MSAKPASYSSASSDNDISAKRSSQNMASDAEDYKPSAKKTKNGSPKKTESPKGKRIRQEWTDEEERAFLDVMSNALKNSIWQAVKEDGRLTHRGGTGVKAHCTALMNKLKKA